MKFTLILFCIAFTLCKKHDIRSNRSYHDKTNNKNLENTHKTRNKDILKSDVYNDKRKIKHKIIMKRKLLNTTKPDHFANKYKAFKNKLNDFTSKSFPNKLNKYSSTDNSNIISPQIMIGPKNNDKPLVDSLNNVQNTNNALYNYKATNNRMLPNEQIGENTQDIKSSKLYAPFKNLNPLVTTGILTSLVGTGVATSLIANKLLDKRKLTHQLNIHKKLKERERNARKTKEESINELKEDIEKLRYKIQDMLERSSDELAHLGRTANNKAKETKELLKT